MTDHYRGSRTAATRTNAGNSLDSGLDTEIGERRLTNSHGISPGINWVLIAAVLGCVAFWALVAKVML